MTESNIISGTSLANGSGFVSRRKLDYYPTPPEATMALVRWIRKNSIEINTICEPASGNGAMSKVLEANKYEVSSFDIQSECYGTPYTDYLNTPMIGYDAIITNPPFELADRFIRKAVGECPVVAMLLKSQYWHANKRISLFNECRPANILALTWRPDFVSGERGGAPTMEVIWTIWIRGSIGTIYDLLERPKL